MLKYDCLTFDKEHIRIAALDEFWDRTITIGSAVRIYGGVSTLETETECSWTFLFGNVGQVVLRHWLASW